MLYPDLAASTILSFPVGQEAGRTKNKSNTFWDSGHNFSIIYCRNWAD